MSRIILGVTFVASGVVKLPSIVNFELYIFSLGLFSFDICSILARLLISTEAIIGLALITHLNKGFTNFLTAGVLVVFSFFLLWRLLLNDESSCHCFGDLIEMSPKISLAKNALLAILLALSWKSPASISVSNIYILVGAAIIYVLPFCIVPPDIYFRFSMEEENTVFEQNLQNFISDSLPSGKTMVCLYSTQCHHCQHCAKKISEIIQRHGIPRERVHILFMDIPDLVTEKIDSFYFSYGNGIHLPYRIVETERFLSLSAGEMPVVILLEDGKIHKEYNYLTIDETAISNYFNKYTLTKSPI